MNDLLSPIFIALNDEVAAFWVWAAFLAQVRGNFIRIDMRDDLLLLRQLVDYMDHDLCIHLGRA